MPRDLGTIITKAIAREPDRRYATAAALAEDLRRFLDGRPILARPVLAAGAHRSDGCRRLPVGGGVSRSIDDRCDPQHLAGRSRHSRRAHGSIGRDRDPQRAGPRPNRKLAIATAASESIEDLLSQASSHIQAGPATKPDPISRVGTRALDRAAEKIGKRFADQPVIEASILHTIGEAYYYLERLFPGVAASRAPPAKSDARQLASRIIPARWILYGSSRTVYMADGKLSEAERALCSRQ